MGNPGTVSCQVVLESCGQVWKLQNVIQAGMLEGDPAFKSNANKRVCKHKIILSLESLLVLACQTQIYILLACSTQGFIFKSALLVLRVYILQMVNFTSSPQQHVFGMGIACKNL